MLKFFGTDGIRGIAGKTIDKSLIEKVANAIIKFIKTQNLNKKIVIAKDTRNSGDWILSVLQSVFLCNGIEVNNVGIAPTAAVAYLAKECNFALGIMISASHNPAEYNGIKLFDQNGYKLDENSESIIENYMQEEFVDSYEFLNSEKSYELIKKYIKHLNSIKEQSYDKNVIFDCSNGASSEIIKKIFNKKTIMFCDTKDEINKNCGCTNIETLSKICKEKKCIGFAFDGDADRLFCVDEEGNVIDGDKNLFILSREFCKSGDEVVGTIASNYGLEKSLEKCGIKLKRVDVGDKYIAQEMLFRKQKLGGESSGHTIISSLATTGDGLVTAISILNILAKYRTDFKTLLKDFEEYKITTINLPCSNEQKNAVKNSDNFKHFINCFEHDLNNLGRILVRPSGTEPKLRIMVEGPEKTKNEEIARKIEDYYNINF